MMRRAKPVLATAAIALSLAACQWMGGGEEQAASTPSGSAGPATPTAQQYPGPGQAQQQAQRPQSVSSDFLQRVQQRLGDRGYDVGPVDGMWGDSTQSALRNFQRDQGLSQSGQLDRQTLAALGIQPPGQQAGMGAGQQRQMQRQQTEPYRPIQQRGQQQGMMMQSVSPDVVQDIQRNLQDRGYDVGQVDGMWGRRTAQALRSFQRDQDIQASGRIDQRTLAALGLGEVQQMGQTPEQPDTDLQRRQRMEQDQLGETPAAEPESDDGLGLFEPEPDIGPQDQP